MMIIKRCSKCKNDYMYDPKNQPEFVDTCQYCKELEIIICKIIGADVKHISISKYLEEGWMTEEDLFTAVGVLLKRNLPK